MFKALVRWAYKQGLPDSVIDEDIKHSMYVQTAKQRGPANVNEALGNMSHSIGIIYRIDNGFIVCINLTGDAHLGSRGALVFAKDAQEVAERIVAHEAAFKISGIDGLGVQHGRSIAGNSIIPTTRI